MKKLLVIQGGRDMNINTLIGITIPALGTMLGALTVFLFKEKIPDKVQKTLLGFASGVMVAASVWSLIIPSLDMSEDMGRLSFIPVVIGFALGVIFLLAMDEIVPHLHANSDEPEGVARKPLKKTTMLLLAITIHNVPEGMAVGVVFAGMMSNDAEITFAAAMALSLGIALQNFPEGSVVSLPLVSAGNSRKKSFLYGTLTGIVEPIASFITILLTAHILPFLPYLLSFAAGAMIYVVVEELLPEASEGEHSNITTIGFAVGFMIMMILDVALA